MTRREDFLKRRNGIFKHCSAMSNSAWCNLNSKSDTLKLHGFCHNPRCDCQTQFTSTPRGFQIEGSGFKNTK